MAVHIIPEHELKEHEESQYCICEPTLMMDEESGEMVWSHQIMHWDKLLDGFVKT